MSAAVLLVSEEQLRGIVVGGRLMETGFCGSTADFCGDTKVPEPSCSGNSATNGRVIGYYEGWNLERSCNSKEASVMQITTC